jgi:hypothetical protein
MLTLREVRAEGFRGIRSGPILRFDRGGLLLLGHNGVGKTSWVDAIEKALTGKCSSVETGDQSLSWAKHGGHIRSDAGPSVTLTLSDGGSKYQITLETEIAKFPRSVQALVSAAKQCSFILRRRTLLDFISAKPLDRYRALEGFLNLDSYAMFERGLKGLQQWVDGQIALLDGALETVETALRLRLTLPAGTPLSKEKLLGRVNQLLAAAGLNHADDQSQLTARRTEAEQLMAAFGDVGALARVNALEQQCGKLPNGESLFDASRAFRQAADALAEEEKHLTGLFFAEVLTKGLEWITVGRLATCPLCDSPIELETIKKSVGVKLASHQLLTGLRTAYAQAERILAREIAHHLEALSQVSQAWAQAVSDSVPEALSICISRLTAVNMGKDKAGQVAETITPTSIPLHNLPNTLADIVRAHKQAFPDQDRYSALFAAQKSIIALADATPKLRAGNAERERMKAHADQLRLVIHLAEVARKTAVQKLVDQVASTASERLLPEDSSWRADRCAQARSNGTRHREPRALGRILRTPWRPAGPLQRGTP